MLDANPWEIHALHELGFTYFTSKHYEEALATARVGIQCKSELLPAFYTLMGNALDELGKRKEAIETYREAIKLNPTMGLIHYNLAISLRADGKKDEARAAVQAALHCEPGRPSSHAVLASLYKDMGYRVPAILAYSRFLLLEPQSPRAANIVSELDRLLTGGVTKGKDDNHININVMMPGPGKELKQEGDFSPAEMMLGIIVAGTAMKNSGKNNDKPATPFDNVTTIYACLGESLENSKPKGGFASTYYAPFFAAVEKAGHTPAFVAQAWSGANLEGAADWAKANQPKIDAFNSWLKSYSWPTK